MKKILLFCLMILIIVVSCKRLDPPVSNNNTDSNSTDSIFQQDAVLIDVDSNLYPTISYYINDSIYYQTWMQKNLTVSHYRNGDTIPEVSDSATWANLTTGGWCWYNNDSATYASTYGKPEGWEIPLKSTWDSLVKFIDNTTDTTQGSVNYGVSAGGPMKQIGTSLWRNPNRGASNTSGFSGLPGGCRTEGSSFIDNRVYGVWWSKTEYSNDYAWFIFLGYDY